MKRCSPACAAACLCALLLLGAAPRGEAVKLSGAAGHSNSLAREDAGASTVLSIASKAEVMAQMTTEKAYKIFMQMNRSHMDPKLIALVQERLGGGGARANLRKAAPAGPSGYSAVDNARDMLNEMMDEAVMKNELEEIRCDEFERKQLKILGELQGDIAYCNSESSKARSEILRCQEVITVVEEVKLPTNRQELEQHNQRCKVDIAALENQLYIVKADIKVMKKIIAMVCAEDVRTVTSAPFLLQEASDGEDDGTAAVPYDAAADQGTDSDADSDGEEGGGDASLVQCPSCGPSSYPFMWLSHEKVLPLLASLKSRVAKQYVQDSLAEAHGESSKVVSLAQQQVRHMLRQLPGINIPAATSRFNLSGMLPSHVQGKCDEEMLGDNASGYRGCQSKTLTGRKCQAWSEQSPHEHGSTPALLNASGIGDHNYCRNPDGKHTIWCYTTDPNVAWEYCEPLLDLEEPDPTSKHECVETDKCTLSKPNCGKLKERFLVILSGLMDKRDELSDELDKVQDECETTRKDYENTISTLEGQLQEEQTNLAAATKTMVENQQQSHLSKKQHEELDGEYHSTMTECCNNKNSLTAEVCALEKIRGELYKLEGTKVFITDCEVGDWADEECSKSCGGGVQQRTRQIIVYPINGTQCPPLKMERACNIEECPIDCVLSPWTPWTECSAPECGGGVQSRYRSKKVEPKYGGLPCTEESETQACNTQPCDADCVLADWGKWSQCSKMCGGGHRMRTAEVAVEAKGQGECPHPQSEQRVEIEECGDQKCSELLPPGRVVLDCTSMIDLVILLDGSGSLRKYGWKKSKAMAEELVQHLRGGEFGVNVGLLLFSGPRDWNYGACAGEGGPNSGKTSAECGMAWVSHLTNDTKEVLKDTKEMSWPNRGTMTSMALAEAKMELINGRQDATSVVIVITDGKPYSRRKTGKASTDLKKVARLVWVPVGKNIKKSLKDIKGWASYPWEDNVMEVDKFSDLTTPGTLNGMISEICPQVA